MSLKQNIKVETFKIFSFYVPRWTVRILQNEERFLDKTLAQQTVSRFNFVVEVGTYITDLSGQFNMDSCNFRIVIYLTRYWLACTWNTKLPLYPPAHPQFEVNLSLKSLALPVGVWVVYTGPGVTNAIRV